MSEAYHAASDDDLERRWSRTAPRLRNWANTPGDPADFPSGVTVDGTTLHDALDVGSDMLAEVRRLRGQVAGHCARIADQSELLNKWAEKAAPAGPPSDAFVRSGEVIKVVDADTFDVRLRLGFHVETVVRVRLAGIDAPERGTPAGKAAHAAALKLLGLLTGGPGDPPPVVTIRSVGWDRLRCLAEVWLADGRNLADELVSSGHARRVGT